MKNYRGIIFTLILITVWISAVLLIFGLEHLANTAMSVGAESVKQVVSEEAGYTKDILLGAVLITALIGIAWILEKRFSSWKTHPVARSSDEAAYITVGISELQKENRILKLQSQLDEEISHLESSRIVGKVLDFLKEKLNFERVSISILTEDSSGFYVLDERKGINGISKGDFIPFGDAFPSEAVKRKEALYTPDIRKRKGFPVDEKLIESGILSGFIVPLIYEDHCIGTINSGSKEVDGIPEETRELVMMLAPRVAQALRNASLFEELKLEKERVDVTLNGIGDAVISTDMKGNISLMNRVAEEFVGKKMDEMAGKPFFDLCKFVSDEKKISLDELLRNVFKKGKPLSLSDDITCIMRNGTKSIVRIGCSPILGNDGKVLGAVMVLRNVTRQRQLEQEINKSRKLESLGVLAGGIAHDFNNILTAILGNVTLSRLIVRENEEAVKLLGDAENAALRAKDLTMQLLTFSRGGEPIKKLSSIAEVVIDSAKFILTGANVKLEIDLPESLWAVEIDKGQISQVIQNIVLNAREAMPSGGTIRIDGRNISNKEAEKLGLLPAKRFIELNITDEGIGIPEQHLGKIFDPYFTTKQRGSGLGLSIAFSIVRNHDGLIRVSSVPGEGTTFTIFLPASNGVSKEISTGEEHMGRHGGRVLVMDDEEIVRNVVKKMLETLGYRVEVAADGEEAIERYKNALAEGRRFDAVIMDLSVPGGMGGREAIAELLSVDIATKAIVSSGYSNDPVMANHKDFGFVDVISKPFKIEELEQVLHRVLEKTPEKSSS